MRAEFEDGWVRLSECGRDDDGYLINPETNDYAMPDEATNRCYVLLTDPDGSQTPDPYDDLTFECVAENERIELKVAARPGASSYAFPLRYELACLADLSAPDPTCSPDAP